MAALADAVAEAAAATHAASPMTATTPAAATEATTATTTPAVGFGADDWAGLGYLNEGVFGSSDGRTRSTSGSTVWRSINAGELSGGASFPLGQGGALTPQSGLDDGILRLEHCTETSEPDKVNDCLSELAVYLDRHAAAGRGGHSGALRILGRQVPRLLSHFKWYIRARAYKLLRRLPSPGALEYCRRYMELCAAHTLCREDSAHGEREQGLRYIRWTMRFDEELWLLGPPVIKALMAVAEQADDRMRNICLETLCEAAVIVPERLWYMGGIRTLVQAALDGPWSTSIAIATTLAFLFDRPETRRFVYAGVTLGGVISALTEPLGTDQMLAERAKVAAFMLTQFLKSWSGIQYFLSDDRRTISALVQSLALVESNCKIILGMLLELFGLSDEFDTVQFQQQPRFDVELLSPFHLPQYTITQAAARTRLLPVDYMRTLLLMVFIDEGLVEALVAVALESPHPDVVDASATLLKWLPQHPHMPLPEKYVARFQILGSLVNDAVAESSARALSARRVISKIEGIPSLSMGQLPSQQMDTWASSLASSEFYRHCLRQRRRRQDLGAQHTARTRRGGQIARLEHADASFAPDTPPPPGLFSSNSIAKGLGLHGSTNSISSTKGLAAGLKDNAVRVLRSSASTGNLKTVATVGAGAGPGTAAGAGAGAHAGGNITSGNGAGGSLLLSPVDESPLTPRGSGLHGSEAGGLLGSRGRRSLDIFRNPQPQTQQQQQQQQQKHLPLLPLRGLSQGPNIKALPSLTGTPALQSSYVQVDNGLRLTTTSIYSQFSTNSGAHPDSAGDSGTGSASPLSAIPVPTSAQHSRARAKSRSRHRGSVALSSNAGAEGQSLATLIQESRVTTEENPMRWNWEVIRMVVLGPVAQSRRLPEEVTVSGFLERLSRFYHPSSLEFCDLSRTASNEDYLELGRHLIRTLISTADGLLLIDESRLLPGIVDEILKQNSSARRRAREDSCFSFARLQMTMSPGYFHFLGEIDRSVGGDSLLERARLFDAYYQVVELPDQMLLIQYILASMSYGAEGHARNILRKVASSPHESLRLLTPSFLLYLASDAPCRAGSVSAWAIEVLVDLVYDPSPAVRSAAAQCLVLVIDLAVENPYLDRAECETRIAYLLDLRPMLDLAVVTDIRPLVLRLVATERGYAYLKEQGLVDSEMEAWGALEGIFFVQSIELDVARALAFGPLFSSTPDGSMMVTTSSQTPPTPAHLFGELARSGGGRAFLQGFGIPRLLFETLANIPWDSALPADVAALKATLWAIGAMGASRDGYLLLEPFDVIAKVLDVAQQAASLSLKGTCLYALGLLSRNSFAAEAFRERGWLLCSSCYGTYEFAVPKRLEAVFNGGGWATKAPLEDTYVFSEGPQRGADVAEDLDSVQREIVEAVIMMSNHVMVNTASKTLMRLSTSHPHYFRLVPLYCQVMHLLGKYRFRLSTRRFIYDVFDVNLASLHEEQAASAMAAAAEAEQHSQHPSHAYGTVGAESCRVSRRFSSSSQHFLQAANETQRKRASTLQGLSSSAATVFARRPTNGLLIDAIRPTRAGSQTATGKGRTMLSKLASAPPPGPPPASPSS